MAKVFSTEDVKLNNSIRVKRERLYSDIDLTLDARIEPDFTNGDGDVLRKTDVASVKQSIKTLLLTNRFEKPYKPSFGGNLGGLLFELMDDRTGDEMLRRINDAIEEYEPRAKIIRTQIVASPDLYSVTAIIEFRVVNTQFSDTLRVKLTETPAAATPVLPVTPPAVPDEILKSEDNNRLVTADGILLRIDGLPLIDGAILTVGSGSVDESQILTEINENILLIEQL